MSRTLRRAGETVALDRIEAEVLVLAGRGPGGPVRQRRSVRDVSLAAADRPGVITECRRVFIPLTWLCPGRRHYCALRALRCSRWNGTAEESTGGGGQLPDRAPIPLSSAWNP